MGRVRWPLFAFLTVASAACDPSDRITFVVNTADDIADATPADDVCGERGTCSLRAALEEAASGDKRSITVEVPTGLYVLDLGELVVDGKVVSIRGVGLQTGGAVLDAQQRSRVLRVSRGLVRVRNVTFQNGSAPGIDAGGGVLIEGTAAVGFDQVTIASNTTSFRGGGLAVLSGATAILDSSRVTRNRSGTGAQSSGGGIYNEGSLTVRHSSITGNVVGNIGGGIGHSGDLLRVENSTISGNRGLSGGLTLSGRSILNNVTVSGNRADDRGGTFSDQGGWGVTVSASGRVAMRNVTVADNGHDSGVRDFRGGGVRVIRGGVLRIKNTLIGDNFAPDCRGAVESFGFNLIEDASDCTVTGGRGDQLGTAAARIRPLLVTLRNNGGLTQTHALPPDSPAVDAGSPSAPGSDPTSCSAQDQRGISRPQEGNASPPAVCDIGAFERNE